MTRKQRQEFERQVFCSLLQGVFANTDTHAISITDWKNLINHAIGAARQMLGEQEIT